MKLLSRWKNVLRLICSAISSFWLVSRWAVAAITLYFSFNPYSPSNGRRKEKKKNVALPSAREGKGGTHSELPDTISLNIKLVKKPSVISWVLDQGKCLWN